MSANVATFEVKVRVSVGKEEYKPICYYGKAEWARDKICKMFHIKARTQDKAEKIARKKYGEPISCRKVNVYDMLGNPENIKLEQPTVYGVNPYKNAVAMDEMIWEKRNKRIKNAYKDKNKV